MNRKRLAMTAIIILSLSAVIGVYAGTVGVNNLFGFTTGYGFTDLNSTNVNAGTEFYRGGVNYTATIEGLIAASAGLNPFDQDLNTTDDVTFNNVTSDYYFLDAVNKTDIFAYPQQPASYIIWEDGGTYYAKNGTTGGVDYSGGNWTLVTQDVLDNLPNRQFNHVQFIGNFTVGTGLRIPSNVTLNFRGSSIFLENNADTVLFRNNDTVNGNSHITILGGFFFGNGGNQASGYGVFFTKALRSKIIDATFLKFKNDGIRLQTQSNVNWIINSRVSQNGANGINIETSDNYVMGCDVGTNNESGILLQSGGGFNHITNNQVFENIFDGIRISNSVRNIVDDNWVDQNRRNGINLYASSVDVNFNQISDNLIRDSGMGGAGADDDGIKINDDGGNVCSFNAIHGNIILDDQGVNSTTNIGINEVSGNYNSIRNNIINGTVGVELVLSGVNSTTAEFDWYNAADDNYRLTVDDDGTLHYTKVISDFDLFNMTNVGGMVVRSNLTTPLAIVDSLTLDGVNRNTWPAALGLADQGLNTTESVVFAEINITGKSELGTQLNVTDEIDVNFEWSGESAVLRVGENIAAGEFVHVNTTGWIKLTDADSNLTIPCIAIALEAINDGDYGLFLMQGWVYNGAWTLDEGRDVYVSTTTGALTVTAPSGSGDQVQVIGIGFTEDLLYFNPDYTILEVL